MAGKIGVPHIVFSEKQILEIADLYSNKGMLQKEIAEIYGVGYKSINTVLQLKTKRAKKFLQNKPKRKVKTVMERFFEKVLITPGCWTWKAGLNHFGYGQFPMIINGKRKSGAHVVSFVLHGGTLKSGMFVCHKCDNPSCVNPDHLWLGTPMDNQIDMMQKKRIQNGERHYMTTLTNDQAREILNSTERNAVLADRYGVNMQVIQRIKSRERWKYL